MSAESDKKDAEDLAVLAAVPKRFDVYTVDEVTDQRVVKQLRVAPMTLNVCGEISDIARAIVEALGPQISMDQLPIVIADHYKDVRAIVAVATKQPEEYIGELPMDQFLIVAAKVWEVNSGFFVHLVGPLARGLAAKMFSGAGPTSSTSAPNTDTTP